MCDDQTKSVEDAVGVASKRVSEPTVRLYLFSSLKVPARLSGVQDGLEINKSRSYFHVSCALFNTWVPLR